MLINPEQLADQFDAVLCQAQIELIGYALFQFLALFLHFVYLLVNQLTVQPESQRNIRLLVPVEKYVLFVL